ncbi:MAG: hypothetical protein KJO11_15670 [Gemmatimonadetes bacterium]|nr:hypothetical protein [Gemmatimonadota bacterium]
MTGRAARLRLVTGRDLPAGDPETRFLSQVLSETGWSVDIAVWSDPNIAWGDADLTVLRSTWDYPDHLDAFLAWCDRAAGQTALHNPPALVAGNVDKRYLTALSRSGVPVVPTRWLAEPTPAALAALRTAEGWPHLVVKPAVGIDGLGVHRWPAGEERAPIAYAGRRHGWIVQPYVSSVRTHGERSVVLVDGEATWSVEKRPGLDGPDIRVQERWGGSTRNVESDAEADALAGRTLAASCPDGAPLYARVDLLIWEGRWHVTEVELIEPSLYLLDIRARALTLDAALRRRLDP